MKLSAKQLGSVGELNVQLYIIGIILGLRYMEVLVLRRDNVEGGALKYLPR